MKRDINNRYGKLGNKRFISIFEKIHEKRSSPHKIVAKSLDYDLELVQLRKNELEGKALEVFVT